jgi:hypothetical protein
LITFLVHEFTHPHQGIHSYNYSGIGRTGFALGLDEYADSMAAYAATLYRQRKLANSESLAKSCRYCWYCLSYFCFFLFLIGNFPRKILISSIKLFDEFPLNELGQDRADRYFNVGRSPPSPLLPPLSSLFLLFFPPRASHMQVPNYTGAPWASKASERLGYSQHNYPPSVACGISRIYQKGIREESRINNRITYS